MNIAETLLVWVIIILAAHSISHTLTTQKVFKPVRDYLGPRMGDYWGELVKCPYCVGHYVSLGLLLLSGFTINITGIYLIDLFIIWHATTGVSNYLTWILCDKIKAPAQNNLPNELSPKQHHTFRSTG